MTTWDTFLNEKCKYIFESSDRVVDIGEGLRARKDSGNRFDEDRAWLQPYIAKVNYQVMDPVPDYKPDIVGDIHAMPFADNSLPAIVCLAVLEHVENPIKAMEEMYRTLEPGGKLLIYVPFLYYYHAFPGYYPDYWRFTIDTLELFAKPFQKHEIVAVRLPIETLIRLTPLGSFSFPIWLGQKLDAVLYKKGSNQVSGYYMYLEK
jgi:SAM-dependent methyltransferase